MAIVMIDGFDSYGPGGSPFDTEGYYSIDRHSKLGYQLMGLGWRNRLVTVKEPGKPDWSRWECVKLNINGRVVAYFGSEVWQRDYILSLNQAGNPVEVCRVKMTDGD